MKLKKLLTLMIISVLMLSGCSGKNKAEEQKLVNDAEPLVENLMQGLNEENYTMFSRDFDDAMKKGMPEQSFKETDKFIKQKIGNYVSKNFWKTQKSGKYTVFYYKMKFDNEPGEVLATISIDLTGTNPLVGGFYLNSPKLLQK